MIIYPIPEYTVLTERSTKESINPEVPNQYSVWSSPKTQNIYSENKNEINVAEFNNDRICIDTYDPNSFELISSKSINLELQRYGGIYIGNDYNFAVFGQDNYEEDDNKTTFRIVKYSKDWNRIGSLDFKKNNTVEPFASGTLRMTESDGYLYIHTAHKMYRSGDDLNHQSNITFSIDIDKMQIADERSEIGGEEYVSHSFDQYILFDDDNKLATLDLGDAYPRSVVLHSWDKPLKNGKFSKITSEFTWPASYDIFKIAGEIGENETGVIIAGFESSENNYLISMHSQYDENTLNEDPQKYLIVCNKNTGDTKKIIIKSPNRNAGGAPYIIKTGTSEFILLWNDEKGVCSAKIDENGNFLTSTKHYDGISLYQKPLLFGNKLIWYADKNGARLFYEIPLPQ